jgi:membrane protein
MHFRGVWKVNWRRTARRVWAEVLLDDCFGASAQLAFYFLLGFFPFVVFIAALVILIAHQPPDVVERATLAALAEVMPRQALDLVGRNVTQILRVLHEKNLRLLSISALLALWPASGGMRAIIVTMNRAYNVREGRGPWRLYAVSLALTLAFSLTALVGLPLISFASQVREQILHSAGPAWATAWHMSGRIAAAMALVAGIELVYYVAPNARRPWHWITAGSIVAVVLWVVATWMFTKYVQRFGRYEALYAGLGAPVVLLLWFYLTGLAILIGGEINAEIERQSGLIPSAAVPAPLTVDAAGHDTTVRDAPLGPD